ncbi:MAG: metallophosphoesterase family protein [Chloroflexota bacterium]
MKNEGKKARYAVLADIHANLPALEAVLADIRGVDLDGVLVAGDMLNGPQPNEVMERLRTLPGCRMIRGNNENYLLGFAENRVPAAWWTNRQMGFVRWCYQRLDGKHLDFIANLPEQRTIGQAIRMVHGSPSSASEYFLPDTHPERFAHAMRSTREAVVIFGHTHQAWQVRQDGRLAFNPGSVGVPMDGDARAQYALLTHHDGQWLVEGRRLAYDLAAIRSAFMESGLYAYGGAFSHGYLYDVLTGGDILPGFVAHAVRQAEAVGLCSRDPIPDDVWEQAAASYSWPEDFPYRP